MEFKDEGTEGGRLYFEILKEINAVWGGQKIQTNANFDPLPFGRVQSGSTSDLSTAFQKFCRETTLHGLIYIGQPALHVIERIFWGIAFVLGILAAGALIHSVTVQFQTNPITVTLGASQASIDQVPFPAITICNVNNAKKSSVDATIRDIKADVNKTLDYLRDDIYHIGHVCLATAQSFSNKLNFSAEGSSIPEDLMDSVTRDKRSKNDSQWQLDFALAIAAQSCYRMIIFCRWEDESKYCWDLFRRTITDFGVCCTFNMAPKELLLMEKPGMTFFDTEEPLERWNNSDLSMDGLLLAPDVETDSSTYPRRSKRSGLSYGLSFLLDPDIGDYFCTSSDSAGFQFITHSPIESPHVTEYGLGIGPDTEAFIKVTPDITVADRAINIMEPERRKCYLLGERSLKYYVNYTYGNCMDECLANVTFEDCGCISYFMTRDKNRNLCGHEISQCPAKSKKLFGKDVVKKRCVECLPTCTDISYTTKMTVRPMRKDKDIWRKLNMNKTDEAWWEKKNVSLVHVYFGDEKVYPKIRKRLFSFTDLIAGTGGILGLCLGVSALSAIELIYFLLVKVLGKLLMTKQ